MVVAILFFIGYTCSAFFITNLLVLLGLSGFNLVLLLVFRISLVKMFKNLFSILFFTIFVFVFNLIFDDVVTCAMTAWKILLVTNFAFIFANLIKPTQLATGISQLLWPLKLCKVPTENVVVVIVIALNFIPILKQEIQTLKQNLRCRNVRLNWKTFFTKSHIVLPLYFAGLLKKTEDLEISLKTRNYQP